MSTESRDTRPLQPAALHILLALGRGERHGYALIGDVDALSDGSIKLGPGTLYGTIKRLLTDGLIEEAEERPDPELDDQRRRYYRLTASGAAAATAELDRLASLVKRGTGGVRTDAEARLMDIYRHLLRVYPRSVREEYRRRDATSASRPARAQRIARTTAVRRNCTRDLIRSAPRLRLEEGMAIAPRTPGAVVTILVAAALVGLVAIGPCLGHPGADCAHSLHAEPPGGCERREESAGLWLGIAHRRGDPARSRNDRRVAHRESDSRWWPVAVGPTIIGL